MCRHQEGRGVVGKVRKNEDGVPSEELPRGHGFHRDCCPDVEAVL